MWPRLRSGAMRESSSLLVLVFVRVLQFSFVLNKTNISKVQFEQDRGCAWKNQLRLDFLHEYCKLILQIRWWANYSLIPSLILYEFLSLPLSCSSCCWRKSWAACNQLEWKQASFNKNELYPYQRKSQKTSLKIVSAFLQTEINLLVTTIKSQEASYNHDTEGSTLTSSSHLNSQWLLKAPGKDNESEEGDAPRLPPQSLRQDSEPNENLNYYGRVVNTKQYNYWSLWGN